MNLKQLHIEINVGNYFKIHSTPLPVPQFLKLISLCLSSSNGNLPYCKFFFSLNHIAIWKNLFFVTQVHKEVMGQSPCSKTRKKWAGEWKDAVLYGAQSSGHWWQHWGWQLMKDNKKFTKGLWPWCLSLRKVNSRDILECFYCCALAFPYHFTHRPRYSDCHKLRPTC